MSDSKDVVGKADAFLSRYRPAAAAEDLPVLTEVVDLPHAGATPPAGPSAAALNETDLDRIERQITQRVLETIQPTLSSFLEEPLRVALQTRLDQALGPLAEQCKADVESIVRDAVAKAVEREIAQLRPQRVTGR
jgi:hypothetical protein